MGLGCDKKSQKIMFGGVSVVLVIVALIVVLVVTKSSGDSTGQYVLTIPQLGAVRGSLGKTAWSDQTIYEFRGIPFAEPPSGKKRFKSPIAVSSWSGIKDATQDGIQCPVITALNKLTTEQLNSRDWEDCLHLSVYTKNVNANSPVMFYIHGGGFINGSAPDHPPNFLLEKDVVLVVTQYRLGALGFLSTKTSEISGNVGVLDVVLALEWVQTNIEHFGGNPEQVTIFGQSAGAGIVSALTISPAVPEGLFHRAILQSGSMFSTWGFEEKPIEKANGIALRGGCSMTSLDTINKCFMDMSLMTLMQLTSVDGFGMTLEDLNNVLPNKPNMLMALSTKRYPVLGGVTTHDGVFQLAVIYDAFAQIFETSSDALTMIEYVKLGLGMTDDTGLEHNLVMQTLFTQEQLVHGNFTEMIPGFVDLSSNVIIKSPTFRFLQLNAIYNPDSTYLYSFDYEGENTRYGYGKNTDHYPFNGGVHHSDDNLYIFPTMKLNEKDTNIAKIMVDLWASFAITGKPESSKVKSWPSLTKITGPYLHINTVPSIGNNFMDEFTVTVNDKENKIVRK